MLFLIHDVINGSDHQFWKNFNDEIWFEVFCGICHDHWQWSLQEMQEALFVVFFSEVHWNPVSYALIVRCELHRFLQKGFDWNVVKVSLALPDVSCSWDFWDLQAQTQLIFFIIEFCMETDELFSDQIILILKCREIFFLDFFERELRPCWQFTTMLAVFDRTLESVGVLNGFFSLHLNCGLILG